MSEPGRSAPSRRQWMRIALGAGAGLLAADPGVAASALHWQERALQGLGTHLHLRAAHVVPQRAAAGLDAAIAAIRHVEQLFSLFDPASALSRLNREGELHHPHPDFVRLLQLAQHVARRSEGAFDVSVQPLWLAWQRAALQHRQPFAQELLQAQALVDWRSLVVARDRVAFNKPGMALTLNGIAQGFASDLARAALVREGIEHALIDTGEWSMLGQSPGALPWQLGVADPRASAPRHRQLIATLTTDGRAVATSSDAFYRFGQSDLHHHILDPRTGWSPTQLASVTVLAPSCALADALTKVMFMGDMQTALQRAGRWKVDVLAVAKSGQWLASAGLAARLTA